VPIIGEHPELSGFYNAIGFSGHGFMLAPMVGQVLSELIVDNRVECIDNFQDFSIKRFEDMEHISFEKNVV
jgi:sarcosine oxidase subunit beta